MKKVLFAFITILSAVLVGKAQEIEFSRAQVDSLLASAAATYEAPSVDGVRLQGTVEELAAEFKQKGWINPYSRFTEQELEKAGLPRSTRYANGVLLEGIFLDRKASLVLYPISPENRLVAYAAVSLPGFGDSVMRFISREVIPLVHRYARKYGEFEISAADESFQNSRRNTTRQEYGSGKHIVTFSFEDPEILIRAQTGTDGKFYTVIHYLNTLNLAVQLLENAPRAE